MCPNTLVALTGTAGLGAIGAVGTTKAAINSAPVPKAAINQNSPESPAQPTMTGASTSDKANDRPIEAPIMAIARVRTSGRVASANQAVTAAEIAPDP